MIKAAPAECIVVVDNCYGEFTEGSEPGAVSSSSACCSTQYLLLVKTREMIFFSAPIACTRDCTHHAHADTGSSVLRDVDIY